MPLFNSLCLILLPSLLIGAPRVSLVNLVCANLPSPSLFSENPACDKVYMLETHIFFLEQFPKKGNGYFMSHLPGTQSFSAVLGKRFESCEDRHWGEEDGERENRAVRDQARLGTCKVPM